MGEGSSSSLRSAFTDLERGGTTPRNAGRSFTPRRLPCLHALSTKGGFQNVSGELTHDYLLCWVRHDCRILTIDASEEKEKSWSEGWIDRLFEAKGVNKQPTRSVGQELIMPGDLELFTGRSRQRWVCGWGANLVRSSGTEVWATRRFRIESAQS